MSDQGTSIGRFFEGWETYNQRIVEVVGELSPVDLAIRPAPDGGPIWATIAPAGLEGGGGVFLWEPFEGQAGKRTQVHTRQAVLLRLLSHDAYHCGELSQTLGIHGPLQIHPWRC